MLRKEKRQNKVGCCRETIWQKMLRNSLDWTKKYALRIGRLPNDGVVGGFLAEDGGEDGLGCEPLSGVDGTDAMLSTKLDLDPLC